MNRVLFSKKSDNWSTPPEILARFKGYFDPCPLNPKWDGLNIAWKKYNFVNPPYSEIALWLNKAERELVKGHRSVFLIPARTDTRWFHDIIYRVYRIEFIKGRLKFGNSKNSAPFPSMLVFIK